MVGVSPAQVYIAEQAPHHGPLTTSPVMAWPACHDSRVVTTTYTEDQSGENKGLGTVFIIYMKNMNNGEKQLEKFHRPH